MQVSKFGMLFLVHSRTKVILGDGNFHAVIMIRPDDPGEVELARELSSRIALKAISLGGTCTGEHGIGVGKRHLLKLEMVCRYSRLCRRVD